MATTSTLVLDFFKKVSNVSKVMLVIKCHQFIQNRLNYFLFFFISQFILLTHRKAIEGLYIVYCSLKKYCLLKVLKHPVPGWS